MARLVSSAPLARFFFSLLVVWLIAWLPVGLYMGDPDFVLTRVSRDTVAREVYQGLLYSGLLLVFLDAWRRHAPRRPARGRWSEFFGYAALGLVSATVLRGVLIGLAARPLPVFPSAGSVWVTALLSAVAVAVVEEAVFRGFLLGHLAQRFSPLVAMLISSALFTAPHLFRPGPWSFKLAYAVGLTLLAMLLARIAWQRSSIAASAGLHAGVIFPNLIDPWPSLVPSWWSGWQGEPASGAIGWTLTLLLWGQWELWQARARSRGVQ